MLPVIETPSYKLEVPSTKEIVEYRPYLVKEEKILLMALEEAGDKKDNAEFIQRATFDIIRNCTFGKVDPEKLAKFDIEYLFLNIRARSRGEEISGSFICQHEVDGEVCGTSNKVSVNIDDVKLKYPEEDLSKVMINDEIGIQFKYLTAKEESSYDKDSTKTDKVFKSIIDSIDYIFDAEKIYKGSDTPKKELLTFIEGTTEVVFTKIKRFFDEQPSLDHTFKYKCSKCGYEEDIKIKGIEGFFGLA